MPMAEIGVSPMHTSGWIIYLSPAMPDACDLDRDASLPIDYPDLRPLPSVIASHPPVQKAVVTVFDSRSMHSRARPRQSIPLRKAVSARCTHPAGVFILPTRNPWSQRALQAHCLPQIGIHPMQSIRCHYSKKGAPRPFASLGVYRWHRLLMLP